TALEFSPHSRMGLNLSSKFKVWLVCGALAVALEQIQIRAAEMPIPAQEYNQWKEALGTNTATTATQVSSASGFTVDLVRSAQPNEGSWVAMTFDPKGRIIIAREDRGLLRLALPSSANGV